MKCSECHKIIWFWQKSFDYAPTLHNLTIPSPGEDLEIYHFHFNCIEKNKK